MWVSTCACDKFELVQVASLKAVTFAIHRSITYSSVCYFPTVPKIDGTYK